MTISPFALIAILVLAALLLAAAAGWIAFRGWRAEHPTIETRREALNRAVSMDEITADEYADKTIALDREAAEARLRRRTK